MGRAAQGAPLQRRDEGPARELAPGRRTATAPDGRRLEHTERRMAPGRHADPAAERLPGQDRRRQHDELTRGALPVPGHRGPRVDLARPDTPAPRPTEPVQEPAEEARAQVLASRHGPAPQAWVRASHRGVVARPVAQGRSRARAVRPGARARLLQARIRRQDSDGARTRGRPSPPRLVPPLARALAHNVRPPPPPPSPPPPPRLPPPPPAPAPPALSSTSRPRSRPGVLAPPPSHSTAETTVSSTSACSRLAVATPSLAASTLSWSRTRVCPFNCSSRQRRSPAHDAAPPPLLTATRNQRGSPRQSPRPASK